MANKKNIQIRPTYISLFSGAGIGCYGFKLENFNCISTVEILEKRLNIQKYNSKCLFENGYICGDIREENIIQKILYSLYAGQFSEIEQIKIDIQEKYEIHALFKEKLLNRMQNIIDFKYYTRKN